MFDGFKITMLDQLTIHKLHNNERLEFDQCTNTVTGEIKNYIADYKGLKIETWPSGRIEINGSFHKYFNDTLHNHDEFTISKMKNVIERLETELDINRFKASVNNLEFGVNINTPFAPDNLINSLYSFKWKQFNIMETKGQGYGKQCKGSSQYLVKIYNKGSQNYLLKNVLRIEKKVVTMVSLKFGQLNLSALLNPVLWEHCKKELINMVNDVLINEPIKINALTRNEQRIYNTVINQSNWINFSRDQRKRNKKAFNNIISKYGNEQYRPIIIRLINETFNQLIST
jgi:hypothetical protein